ncbi:MAG TPA: hypothetical protein VI461_15765, partial [Chitinophagaceae bacterium]|nr:hypothetical protein [Chitinophagaceae bacterium]
ILSNRNAINQGTDFLLTSEQEQGLFLSSASDLPQNIKDSLFSILVNGNAGIGVKFPSHRLQVHSPSSAATNLNITNSVSGAGLNNGLLMGMNSNTATIFNYEAGDLQFGTNNLNRVTIDVDGNTGFGLTNPDEKVDVSGNIKLSGEINRPSTTTTNLLPIAWGNVAADGTVYLGSSSGNFTVTHTVGSGFYQVAITGESYQFQTYSAIITPVSSGAPRIATTGSGGGQLQVYMWDITGADVDSQFNFVVYKK